MVDFNDPLMQLHLSVAKIEGMLSTVITSHGEKIVALETRTDSHDKRLNDKAKTLAGHSERIDDLEDDIREVRNTDSGRAGRNVAISSLVISGIVGFTTVIIFIQTIGVP